MNTKRLLLMGGALFSMHFGASCMLYPVTWGKESGTAVFPAYAGVFFSGILITALGYIALAKGKDTFWGLAGKLSPRFGRFFCTITVLLIGPLYVVPRMSASAWDAIVQLFSLKFRTPFPMIAFNIAIYGLVFYFTTGDRGITDRIGRILTPLQLVIVSAVVLKGLISPIGTAQPPAYSDPPFVYGFLQGYATGDLLCALLFGAVVIGDLERLHLDEKLFRNSLIKIAGIGMGILAIIHLGHMTMGSLIGNQISLSYAALYAQAAVELWGLAGGIVFSIALLASVLSCGIGLTASCADYFSKVPIGHKACIACICAVSAGISCLNLNNIILLIGPFLDACYPSAILLVLYYTFMPEHLQRKSRPGALCAVVTAFVFGLLHMLYIYSQRYAIPGEWYSSLYLYLPLAKYNFAWVPAAGIGYCIGNLCCMRGGFSALPWKKRK